jgi:hypothetical protein
LGVDFRECGGRSQQPLQTLKGGDQTGEVRRPNGLARIGGAIFDRDGNLFAVTQEPHGSHPGYCCGSEHQLGDGTALLGGFHSPDGITAKIQFENVSR